MTASSASSASSFSERSLQVLNLKDRFGSVPRFGHSSDFSNLYSTNQDEYNDYIVGLLTMGLIFLSIFMTWLLLLLVFKLCGAKVGFLSGTPFQATSLDDPKNGLAVNPWISLSRIIFGTSVFFMLVFGLLLITAGIGNLDTTTQTIGYGAEQGYEYLANAQFLLNEAFASIDLLKGFKDNLIVELKLFHVAIQQAKQVLEEGGDGYIEASVTLLITGMEALEDFLQEPLTVIDSSLVEGQQNCLEIQDATQTVDLTGIQMGIGIIVTLIPALALACLYHFINQHEEQQQQSQQSQQAQRRRSSMKEAAANTHVNDSCRTWFVWPTFLILTLICIGAGSAMSIVGLLNSDFCLGGDDQTPDSTIMAVLEKQGTPPESFEYRAIEFVVRECELRTPAADPLTDVNDLEDRLNQTIGDIQTTVEDVATVGAEMLTNTTGYNATIITNQLQEFEGSLTILLEIVREFLEDVACQGLHEIYSTVMHQAACTNSYTGTFWVFLSLIMMAFFGLLAITFRSAMYPVIIVDADLEFAKGKNDADLDNDDDNSNNEIEHFEDEPLYYTDSDDEGFFESLCNEQMDSGLFPSLVRPQEGPPSLSVLVSDQQQQLSDNQIPSSWNDWLTPERKRRPRNKDDKKEPHHYDEE